jgi:hypothetical protein
MEPLPESQVAAYLLGARAGTERLADLRRKADAVRDTVPELTGASITWTAAELTMTVVAGPADVRTLEALHRLRGETQDVDTGDPPSEDSELVLDERRWSASARSTSDVGVASTLSFPLRDRGLVVGSVDLYAGARCAFAGLDDELVRIFGGWVSEVVRDADLGFRSRDEAVLASHRLARAAIVDHAVAITALRHSLRPDGARRLLEQAARATGVDPAEIAVVVIEHWS